MKFTHRWAAGALVALTCSICLLLPTVALADVTIEDYPAAVSNGTTVTINGISSDAGLITVVAKHASGRSYALTQTANVADDSEGRFSVTFKFAYGGRYVVTARAAASGDVSNKATISCDPAKLSSSINKHTVSFARPATLKGQLKSKSGRVLKGRRVQLWATFYDPENGEVYDTDKIRTVTTDKNGRVKASVKESENTRWYWKFDGDSNVGSKASTKRVTKPNLLVFGIGADPGTRYSGKIKLVKGRKYQLSYRTANEADHIWFKVNRKKSVALNIDLMASRGNFGQWTKTFKAKTSGLHTWKVRASQDITGISSVWYIW